MHRFELFVRLRIGGLNPLQILKHAPRLSLSEDSRCGHVFAGSAP